MTKIDALGNRNNVEPHDISVFFQVVPRNKPRKRFLYPSMANEEDDPIIQEVKVHCGSSDCT